MFSQGPKIHKDFYFPFLKKPVMSASSEPPLVGGASDQYLIVLCISRHFAAPADDYFA